MLVAKKYDFLDYEDYSKEDHHRQKNVKKTRCVKRVNTGRTLMLICMFFAVGFIIVQRHVYLTQMANKINEQKQQISSLEKVNSQLKTETVVDISEVDDIAKNKLGMDRPEKYQLVYVNLDKDNNISNSDTIAKPEFEIAKSISKIVNYLY